MKNATSLLSDSLILYAELTPAQLRSVQRRIKAQELKLMHKGVATSLPEEEWPRLVEQHRLRLLAALHPDTVIGYRSAFDGGSPSNSVLHLTGSYRRSTQLPGLTVHVWKGSPPQPGDQKMMGRPIYFPSLERLLMENLLPTRGTNLRTVGKEAIEDRLLSICDSRGETALQELRQHAKQAAPALGLEAQYSELDAMVGSILHTRPSVLISRRGQAITADIPFDSDRLALFEHFAGYLRANPLPMPAMPAKTALAHRNFAFLESYFSNFIEGTEFDINDARGFCLEGRPIETRPKDSHDIIGVFEQANRAPWSTLTMASGEAVLEQLRERHKHQMQYRPEVSPGEFKLIANRAGNSSFVGPDLVRGTLIAGSRLLPSVPAGTARALLAMFLVAEVHPWNDGNGRQARLVMNAELSSAEGCRIIVPTLFREEYLDCLRELTRNGRAKPFVDAMVHIQDWTSRFFFDDLDHVIAQMTHCHAFERSRAQYELLMPDA